MTEQYVFDQWPTPERGDSTAVLVNRWHASTADRQRRFTRDMIDAVWGDSLPAAMLSFSLFLSEDERTLMAYKQWTSKADYDDFLAERGLGGAQAFRAANPDVDFAYDWFGHYRGVRRDAGPPGCVVLVGIEPASAAAGKRWAAAATAAQGLPAPECVSAQLHIGLDSTAMLNYAEWDDADSHRRWIESGEQSRWQTAHELEGVRFAGFTRYRLLRAIARPLSG